MTRETIYSALFDKIGAAAPFVTASRRLRHWQDVGPSEQPALFMAQRNEVVEMKPGMNPVTTLHVDVYLYARTNNPDKSPGQILNPLLDAVVATLGTPDSPTTNKLTLGGLVQHCWIEGTIETDEGVLGDQGVVIVPVAIKTA